MTLTSQTLARKIWNQVVCRVSHIYGRAAGILRLGLSLINHVDKNRLLLLFLSLLPPYTTKLTVLRKKTRCLNSPTQRRLKQIAANIRSTQQILISLYFCYITQAYFDSPLENILMTKIRLLISLSLHFGIVKYPVLYICQIYNVLKKYVSNTLQLSVNENVDV